MTETEIHVTPTELDAACGDDRARMLEHVGACASCRRTLANEDPSALFGLLALQPIPEAQLDRLSRRVEEAIDGESIPADARGSRRRFAGIAASLLLAAGFLGYMQRYERGATVTPVPASTAAVASSITDSATASWVAPLDTPRSIEVLETPGTAEIVDFAVGDTQVVMIFDEELDI